MKNTLNKPALNPATISERSTSSYPREFGEEVAGRSKRVLGDALGLKDFGVNLTRLQPGAWSAQRHWHTSEDEFIYVVSGEATLVTDEGEQTLGAGMTAGFVAGVANGHHLVNNSKEVVEYLEVGARYEDDEVHYPDIDLLYRPNKNDRNGFTRKNGEPIKD